MLSRVKSLVRRVAVSLTPTELRRRTPITLYDISLTLPDRPVIVEAGAHDGSTTVQLARIKPGATVHAFEPIPKLFGTLTHRTTGLNNVCRYQVALGDRTADVSMHVSSGATDAASSVLPPKDLMPIIPHLAFQEQVTVSCTTLDEWAARHGVSKVDFLWLDLQGYELSALRGGERLLRSVCSMYCEVNLIEMYAGVPLYHEVRSWLRERGFAVARVDFPNEAQGDVLFVRDPSLDAPALDEPKSPATRCA
jgi:FkbM family methyltransferase